MSYRPCDTDEADIGMLYYLSDVGGTGGRIKTYPEDFRVTEISNRPPEDPEGRHTVATVTGTNWESNRMIRLMAREMGISRERIGFAGTKDKRAVTSQLMSFECPPDTLKKINLKDIEISDVYTAKNPVRLGNLVGNEFSIRVRDLDLDLSEVPEVLDKVSSDIDETGGFPNYFGVQRFGVVRPVTHIVGERIVRGDIEGAVRTYLSEPSKFENEDIIRVRKELAEREDWRELLKIMPESLGFEKSLVGHLMNNPEDWTGALSVLPNNLQMMFVHAYQSYLFNVMLSKRMEKGLPLNLPVEGDTVIPLTVDGTPDHNHPVVATSKNLDLVAHQVRTGRAFVSIILFGSDTEIQEGVMGEIESSVIEAERIGQSNFIVPELTRCSSKGSRREIVCTVNDLSYSPGEDFYDVNFSLTKGNYATTLMREFMKSPMLNY
ncbi:MAG: tRNA pseudouridine(13) synthase TruD [Candidatus Methanomethylophilaceae archaeon]|jgi:tRNA pseudouridine13 synthase